MAVDEPMAIIIGVLIVGQQKRGEMSDFSSSSSSCTLIGIIQIARHASRVGGWDCPTNGGKMIGLRRRREKWEDHGSKGPLGLLLLFPSFFPSSSLLPSL